MTAQPSYFAAQGESCCSIWGKAEIEVLAWAYVQALANLGDEWGRMLTPQECFDALTEAQRHFAAPYIASAARGGWAEWWTRIAAQLTSAEGAFEVGGLAWNRRRFEKANTRDEARR